ncbi:hypothetical protein [Variovorax sp. GB1P17]|uniref:hypothetical protein n=1 Tax=Variovorax sp. GB1P17 TaxID=3443740 RepID=UPI003F488634
MNVLRLWPAIGALVMLSACSPAKYLTATGIKGNSYVGKPFKEVIKEYGPPTSIKDSAQDPNFTMMMYEGGHFTATVRDTVGTSTRLTPGGPEQTVLYRDRQVERSCLQAFWVDKKDQLVKVFDWSGNCW